MHLPFSSDSAPATFLIGGAGAGKTELALNLSVWHAARNGRSILVDLDIVNPFFRVRKLRQEVEKRGVTIVCPEARVVSGDMPALPRAAWGAIEQTDVAVTCDIGGGEQGLRPLGRLKDLASERHANVFFVINPFRPGFMAMKDLAVSFAHMVGLSAMTVTHVVANPNIAGDTTVELFQQGLRQVKEFVAENNLQFGFAVCAANLAGQMGLSATVVPGFYEMDNSPVFVIERYWNTPWHFGVEP